MHMYQHLQCIFINNSFEEVIRFCDYFRLLVFKEHIEKILRKIVEVVRKQRRVLKDYNR